MTQPALHVPNHRIQQQEIIVTIIVILMPLLCAVFVLLPVPENIIKITIGIFASIGILAGYWNKLQMSANRH